MKAGLFFVLHLGLPVITAENVPQTVEQTWANYDARAELLETETVRESIADGIVLRYVRYVVGTFGGKKTKVAAFHAFPVNGKNLPGIVQLHGGGQRALPDTVQFWASHGYAAISVNWGGKVIGEKDDPNTDWAGIPAGFLDPKHHNNVTPGKGTIHDVPNPWNSSWLLYAAAARRAITFLERQPESDGSRVGLTGHSMGGRLTILAAIDPRVKAATPSVGGSGYLYSDITGVPGSARRMRENLDLYKRTLDCRYYWPLIKCPVMFLGATNDFNSPMEKVIQGFRSLPDRGLGAPRQEGEGGLGAPRQEGGGLGAPLQEGEGGLGAPLQEKNAAAERQHHFSAMSFTPHMNHRFTADNFAARVRWFETYLKDTFKFPKMAQARLDLKADDGIPRFTVQPDLSTPHKLKSVSVLYGFDRDPRARFWRSAEVTREGDVFSAECPVMELTEPLFVFANVTYDTGAPLKMPRGYPDTPLLTVTSQCRKAFPNQLKEAGVKPTGERQRLIEDFKHGWQDWSLVGVGHRAHWNYETHKVNDPAFVGPRGASLALEIETTAPNETLAVVVDVDRWRGYTRRKPRRFTALVDLAEAGSHIVKLSMEKFVTPEGEILKSYDFVTSLILTPGQKEQPDRIKKEWQGKVPTFKNIRWEGGSFATRPRPYLKQGASEIDADAAFRRAFEKAVDESVEREKQDRK
jgi:dienelactone hydrolase